VSRFFPRRLPWLLLISALVIFADRVTKIWVTIHVPMGGAIPVIPRVLRITHWTNDGAAFSLFAASASPNTLSGTSTTPNCAPTAEVWGKMRITSSGVAEVATS